MTPPPPPYFYFRDLLACTTGLIVSRDNQTTKPWSFSARTGIHELYILLAKPFEIPNQRAKSFNSKLNISFINTRSNWSATSSWKENVFSIFNSLTKVKKYIFRYPGLQQRAAICHYTAFCRQRTGFSDNLNTLFVYAKYFCLCKRSLVVSPWFRVCVIIFS